MFKGMGDMGQMMKKAQEMQQKMQQIQEDAANVTATGESGAGLVKVTMTGRHDVRKVEIDASLMTEDKEMLEDLLAAAVNDAVRRVEQVTRDKMAELTAGLPLPPGFKLPF